MLIGHKKQLNILKNFLVTGEISQAYIFNGPESVGKFSLAKAFSLGIIKGESDFLKYFNKKELEQNQDMHILGPEIIKKRGVIKIKDIEIEKVREMQKLLSLYPSSGKKRVLIIDDAQNLTKSSQNALLKTLEEPNNSTVIILVTNRDGRILKTIQSRCQKINFNLVSLEEIKDALSSEEKNDVFQKIAIFSMGKPGDALKMREEKEMLKEKENMINDLANLKSMAIYEKMEMAERYSKDLPLAQKTLEFWIWVLRLQVFKNMKSLVNIKNDYLIINRISETLLKIKNPALNSRLILENLFIRL